MMLFRDTFLQAPGEKSVISFYANGCRNKPNELSFIEHVEVVLTIRTAFRGDLKLTLVSPMKTNSTLLHYRSKDASNTPLKNWPFMTTHFWGENPRGKWILEISCRNRNMGFGPSTIENFTILFYGTYEFPIPARWPNKRKGWARYIKKQLYIEASD
ncbi:hypothetical protein GJ496_000895 [Pomphorhynchus laevis]|nr:hypothetical protein GJ496_000895 [Pomphorhynchus laevis]